MEIELENFDGALNMAVRRQRVHLGWRSAVMNEANKKSMILAFISKFLGF